MKRAAPPSKEFETLKELKAWSENNEVSVVFFGTNENLFPAFQAVARKMEELSFGHCSTPDCIKHYKAKPNLQQMFQSLFFLKMGLGKQKKN